MAINFLLPMKGHSERVPDKNMKMFRGRPLYHAIMNVLHKSRYAGKIFVDTDSQRISEDLHKNFPDVTVIERPGYLCGDDVSMNRIIEHDLSLIKNDNFLQTHSTNPLLRTETIDRAIDFFFNHQEKFDSVFGVNRIQSRLYREDGKPINHDPENLIKTQDLPVIYEENSNLYIFSRDSFEKAGKRRIGKNPYMFEIPEMESLDIDVEADFNLALLLYNYLNKTN
jgi:CMP-N-acetylneuraminic acid synthetase